jgi:serine phosphatase RsbU (regulator of sigma subunit)
MQLAPVFGMAVANVRAIETIRAQEKQLADEMRIAGAAQRELLQKGFQNDELTLRTVYAPYRWVSGDFFGYSWRSNRRLLRGYLLDVTGHGVATALQTAATSVILNRALIESPLWNPRLLEELNPQMMQYFSDATFAAIMLFEFDLVEAEVRITGGGIHHFFTNSPTPLWQAVGGSYAGLLPNPDFGQLILPLKRDSFFCFMTDGLSERLQGGNGQFLPLSYNQACDMLQASASAQDRWDDCTAVCINIKGLCAAGECASG